MTADHAAGRKEAKVADELEREYIKSIMTVVEEDKKSVLLYVAFDLSVVSLTLSGKIFNTTTYKSPIVAAGLCLLLVSAALFFNYYRKVHLSTFLIADQLLKLNVKKARAIPTETWERHRFGYRIGYVVRLLGLAVLIAAFVSPSAPTGRLLGS
jgi:hypothetical protein